MCHGRGVIVSVGEFESDEDAFNYALEFDYGMKLEE
jgi:hypothetical protein